MTRFSPRQTIRLLGLTLVLITASLAGCGDDNAKDGPEDETDLSVQAVEASPQTGQAPLEVSFSVQATSSAEPISARWDFGDGETGRGARIDHTYTEAGEYSAKVAVEDSAGASETETIAIVVEAADPPVATASATPNSGIAPLNVSFGTQITGGSGEYSYSWDFGDGSTSAGKTPSHRYTDAGTFTASVVVTDEVTAAVSQSATVEVQVADNQTPVASASASPAAGIVPLTVSLSGSVVGGNEPFAYQWNFGDGSAPADAQSPAHEYTTPGIYSAIFQVTDADGQTSSANVQIEVTDNSSPITELEASPEQGIAPLTVQFDPHVQGGDPPLSLAWEFGDGETATSSTPSHTYESAGDYSATVTVTDANGDVATDNVGITATDNTVPTVAPTATPQSGLAPLPVQFGAHASGGDGQLSFQWNFGDGQTATTANPTHTYQSAGQYMASVTATDANGDAASDDLQITVGDDQTPSANASASPDHGYAPLDVDFFGNANGGNGELSYQWNFGDGDTSTAQNPTHTYANAGTYSATLIVTDSDGDTDSSTEPITVTDNSVAQVTATASPQSGTAPFEVDFNANGSNGNPPLSYEWNFGDGSPVVAGANPSHSYTTGGSYEATVTVTDNNGDTSSDTVSIQAASNSQPAVEASTDVNTGPAPLTVQLSATATGGNGELSYQWYFGDGTAFQSGPNVSHTYNNIGVYDAQVIVTDADGDTAQDTVQINALDTSPDLSVQSVTTVAGNASVTYEVTIVNQGTDVVTEPFFIDFYDNLSAPPDDSMYSSNDEFISQDLDVGETITVTHTVLNLTSGDYTPYLVVNPFESIPDLDRSNNIAAGPAFSVEVLLINELLYRTDGSDTGTFIELFGTAGKDVSGYKLVAVNGNDGDPYATYEFPAGTTVPPDGYLVIGDGSAADEDLTDDFVDLQNGPDSLVLETPAGTTIDGVGYGDFSGNRANSRAESISANNSPDDYSLGRDDHPIDKNDNRADFYHWRVPTPGRANGIELTNDADTCADAYLFADGVSGHFHLDGDVGGLANDFTSTPAFSPDSCDYVNEDLGGPDQVFRFAVPSGKTANVELQIDDSDANIALASALTGSPCTAMADGFLGCSIYSAQSFQNLASGTYYIVVFQNSDTYSTEPSAPFDYTVGIDLN